MNPYPIHRLWIFKFLIQSNPPIHGSDFYRLDFYGSDGLSGSDRILNTPTNCYQHFVTKSYELLCKSVLAFHPRFRESLHRCIRYINGTKKCRMTRARWKTLSFLCFLVSYLKVHILSKYQCLSQCIMVKTCCHY